MKRLLSVVLIIAGPAYAESSLARFEHLSVESNNLMLRAMLESAVEAGASREALQAALPVFEWNAAISEAGTCTHDALLAEIGADGMAAMLNDLEDYVLSAQGMTLDQIMTANAAMPMPEGLTEDRSIDITQGCGMIAAQTAWMADTGFLDVMMAAAAGN